MTAKELRQKYFDFFISKGHKLIPSASLIPENDRTALFTSAGMHPLVPYLLGEAHPLGKRLVSVQKCLRTDDIGEVGNNVHHTFFQMLGNWSLGDYFKKEMIPWSLEFLTDEKWLGIPKEKLAVSVFAGDEDAPFDQESFDLWLGLGISEKRIAKLPKKNNWWGPVGSTGPCGPDSEMFYWLGDGDAPVVFDPEDKNWVEIWNDVFMEYNKKEDGTYEPLKQKNVDTGMGLERTLAVLNGLDDNYKTDLFWPIIQKLEELSGKKYENNKKEFRIIADHTRASVFLLVEDILPRSEDRRGAVLRRLLDRAISEGRKLNISGNFLPNLGNEVVKIYKENYPLLEKKKNDVENGLFFVEKRVEEILATPSQEAPSEEIINLSNMSDNEIITKMNESYQKLFGTPVEEYIKKNNFVSLPSVYAGTLAFNAKTTEGRPVSLVEMEAKGSLCDNFNPVEFYKSFNDYFEQHKDISKEAGAKLFKGGLADHSEIVTKYHTATHLLNAALREILGDHVYQKGSNITGERLRFDFPNPEKLPEDQIKKIEDLVNEKIKENLPVTMESMSLEEAKKSNANAVFSDRYGDQVKVYSIGEFSKEVCGGPHVDFTGTLGKFKIIKEESAGAGIRRLYAILE